MRMISRECKVQVPCGPSMDIPGIQLTRSSVSIAVTQSIVGRHMGHPQNGPTAGLSYEQWIENGPLSQGYGSVGNLVSRCEELEACP